jgi:hypothetical protein
MVPCGNRSLSGVVSARQRFSLKLNEAIGYGTIKPGLEIRTRCVRPWLRSFIEARYSPIFHCFRNGPRNLFGSEILS